MSGLVLVTGANGFLGRAVLSHLGSSRRISALVREMPNQPLPGNAPAIVHDLRKSHEPEISDIPTTVVHLAQSSRYREFPKGALDVFDVNVASTQRLLYWAHRSGVKRFIYASSGAIYGDSENAFEEDSQINGIEALGHYAASKLCGELLADAYRNEMIVVILRFFFIYGPGQRNTMLIPRLIDSVLHCRPIMLQGDNGIGLNPVYVDDAVTAVEAALELDNSDIINVGGPHVVTLREIGALIGKAIRRQPRFQVDPNTKPKHLIGSVRKMSQRLGAPRIGMAEGLQRTLKGREAA